MTSFYTNRKTVRLRIRLGMDAFWIPPRLWAYAAVNQPDGDMSAYSAEELAELIGYPSTAKSNAQAMLQALKECGFIDESGLIHDWHEHNGYHQTFADRAKKAAAARWKEKTPTPPKEDNDNDKEREREASIATSNASSIQAPPSPRVAKATPLTDEEFLNSLEGNPTYEGLNIKQEYGKMVAWCSANRKQPNRRRFVNWINRCDRPMKVNGVKNGNQPDYEAGF